MISNRKQMVSDLRCIHEVCTALSTGLGSPEVRIFPRVSCDTFCQSAWSAANTPTVSPAIRQLPALERSLFSLPSLALLRLKPPYGHGGTRWGDPRILSPLTRIISTSSLENWDGPKVDLLPCPVRPGLGCSNIFQISPIPSDGFHIVRDHHILVSVPLLSDLLVKQTLLHPSHPTGPSRTQFTIPPLATWTKCRVAAPKIWAHQGAMKSADGAICKTTASLDKALRATRSFWQDFPTPYHPTWTSLLADYSQQVTPIPPSNSPGYNELYKSIITSPDSACRWHSVLCLALIPLGLLASPRAPPIFQFVKTT